MADDKTFEFTGHYNDLSTPKGFQWEFVCSRCGRTVRSKFDALGVGVVSDALETASGLFGGIFGTAANVGEKVRSAAWEKAHDKKFLEAVEEMSSHFVQCPRCQSWVCREKCLNEKRGLCKACAPDLGVEMSAAQASRSVEEIWAHAAMAEEDKKLATENWRDTIVASCPNCHQSLETNAKFCPSCGANLKPKSNCPKCNAKLSTTAKFCPECGEKIG